MRFSFVATVFLALTSSSLAAAPAAPAVAPAVAGDAVRGAQRFKAMCGACHTIDPAKKSIGPHLKGVIGRKAGTVEGFLYSAGLKKAGWVWDAARLDPYLANPSKVVPGSKMASIVSNPKDRADIIAYLATVK